MNRPVTFRRLTTIPEYEAVLGLEKEIWGYTNSDDAVPPPIMIVTGKIGGILLGAFDETGRMVGFVYSLPGIRDGKPFQWSHMLGVVEAWRNAGLGWRLKLEQRRVVLDSGLDLVEWTFDPLQALNAHLNFVKLGAIVSEYHENVYGESSSTLHRGTPTDRFIAEWWVRSPHVQARLDAIERRQPLASIDPGDAAQVNEVCAGGEWLTPGASCLSLDAARLLVSIPTGFTEMQINDPALALAWRLATREIFTTYLPRGYRIVDFILDRPANRGSYLLTR